MKRSQPLKADPEKQRAWQQRGAQAYAASQKAKTQMPPRKRSRNVKPRRNDAPWRNEVAALRGTACRACGNVRDTQCDHVWPRGQGGPSVVENGSFLCRVHHEAKTAGLLQYRFEWLDEDQVAWLAEVGWVTWDDDGLPHGRGWRHFAPRAGAR